MGSKSSSPGAATSETDLQCSGGHEVTYCFGCACPRDLWRCRSSDICSRYLERQHCLQRDLRTFRHTTRKQKPRKQKPERPKPRKQKPRKQKPRKQNLEN